jgi:amino acid adenylation domain-containing protein
MNAWSTGAAWVAAGRATSVARFLEQAARAPGRTAIHGAGAPWTYGALATAAGGVAAQLAARGIGRGARVGVAMTRRPELVAAVLGIVMRGAAYVPLDPTYPAARLRMMLERARCAVVITDDADGCGWLEGLAPRWPYAAAHGAPDLEPATADDLHHVIFTSGSTGRPKGVAVSHRGVMALLDWATERFDADARAAVFASTSLCFDLSVFELFLPLATGGALVLARDVLHLVDHPDRARVTLVNTVPSALAGLLRLDALPASTRVVNLAGELFPAHLAAQLHRRAGLATYNLYGPTEDTTYSTEHRLVDDAAPPIGRPLPGTRAYVLDAALRPCDAGEPGELYLAGAGLADGYLFEPAFTAARFVPDPFGAAGDRMYRTGDLACWLASGELRYLGRADAQVKLRGYRIELDDVACVLASADGVDDATAAILLGPSGDPRLVGYVAPLTAPLARVRAHAADRLPAYMQPSALVALAALPHTLNGKIDRAALPAPRWDAQGAAPEGHLEAEVARAWSEVLGVDGVGRDCRFGTAGGDSLAAARVIARLAERTGHRLAFAAFFAAPTIAGLATALADAPRASHMLPPLSAAAPGGGEPSATQEQMWILDRVKPGRRDYLTGAVLAIRGSAADRVQRALRALVARHPALRSRLVEHDGELRVACDPPPTSVIPVVAVRDAAEARAQARRAVDELAARPLDLARELPYRARLFDGGDGELGLALVVHHTAFDARSLAVVVRELATLDTMPGSAPAVADPVAAWAAWSRLPSVRAREAVDLARACAALAGAPTELTLGARANVGDERAALCELAIDPTLVSRIDDYAATAGATRFAVLLAAFGRVIAARTGTPEVVIGTAVDGRELREIEDAVGCFTNLVPLRVAPAPSFAASVARASAASLDGLDRGHVPFHRLVDALHPPRRPGIPPLVQVALGVEPDPRPRATAGGVVVTGEEVHLGHARLELTAWLRPPDRVAWTWRVGALDEAQVRALHADWLVAIERGLAAPSDPAWGAAPEPAVAAPPARVFRAGRAPRRSVDPGAAPTEEAIADGAIWAFTAPSPGASLATFTRAHRARIRALLREHGAVLIRGHELGDAPLVGEVVDALFDHRVHYGERSSPRSKLSDGVYTSTDHPPDQPIVLHNEQSYTLNWPLRILFYCRVAPTVRGATPVADGRRVLAELDREVVAEFARRGVMYQRNYLPGVGVSWQDAFQTRHRGEADAFCHARGITTTWLSEDHLRTRQIRPALRHHPETGELLWFNHALFFHVTSVPPELARGLTEALGEDDYPTNTYFGDGAPFSCAVLDHLRAVTARHVVAFPWRTGDLLVLDNMRFAHGREPFSGPRQIFAAMADPIATLYGAPSAAPGGVLGPAPGRVALDPGLAREAR